MPAAQHVPPALSGLEIPPASRGNPQIKPQAITRLHHSGKSAQTDFFPWCYRLFSELFLCEV
jgi:hypothetical protein